MPTQNYQGAPNSDNVEVLEVGWDIWWKIYNHTAAAFSNGAIKLIQTKVDYTDTSNPIVSLVGVAPAAAEFDGAWIGVVDNTPLGQSTIPAYGYGFVKIRGYCSALCNGATGIIAGDQLLALAAATAFTVSTAPGTGYSTLIAKEACAIAMESYPTATDALKKVVLLGRQCHIAA